MARLLASSLALELGVLAYAQGSSHPDSRGGSATISVERKDSGGYVITSPSVQNGSRGAPNANPQTPYNSSGFYSDEDYFGGQVWYGPAPAIQPLPMYVMIAAPPQVRSPVAPASPQPARPSVEEVAAAQPSGAKRSGPEKDEASRFFSVALKDHSVHSAVACWLQGDELHFITPQGERNAVSLDLVDGGVTSRLNGARNLSLILPSSN